MVSTKLLLVALCVMWITAGSRLPPVSSHAQTHQQCNFTLSINSSMTLQQAIIVIVNNHSVASKCVRIELLDGMHMLTSQIVFPAEVENFELVGFESHVKISCAYDVRSDYTWYFDHLSSVTFRGIHFESCPRPLRLDTISNVTIQNCSFR